jgi:hypothetical protein
MSVQEDHRWTPISLLAHLLLGGPAPVDPFPACGSDPTADGLDCPAFAGCR